MADDYEISVATIEVGNLRHKSLALIHSARIQHVKFEGEVIHPNLIPRGSLKRDTELAIT